MYKCWEVSWKHGLLSRVGDEIVTGREISPPVRVGRESISEPAATTLSHWNAKVDKPLWVLAQGQLAVGNGGGGSFSR